MSHQCGINVYLDNDHVLRLNDLEAELNPGVPVDDATVTFDLRTAYSPGGTSVEAGNFVSSGAGTGDYHAELSRNAVQSLGKLFLEITAVSGGKRGFWSFPARVIRRGP